LHISSQFTRQQMNVQQILTHQLQQKMGKCKTAMIELLNAWVTGGEYKITATVKYYVITSGSDGAQSGW